MYENNIENIIEAQNGSKEKMQQLIEENNGLIWSIVKRFNGRGYETEDLYQIGCMGFIKSIKRFDASFDVKLSTYAVPYILGEIKKFIRDDGPIKVSRSLKELNCKIGELQNEYISKKGREITLNEIVQKLKVPKEEIIAALDSKRPVDSIETATYRDAKTDNTINLIEKISSGKDEQNTVVNKIVISELIKDLNQRERQIIMLRYYKEKTQMQVSEILGISQVQVSRIERKILNSMKEKIVS